MRGDRSSPSTLAGPADGSEAQFLARATIAAAASAGIAPAPQLVLRAMAGGAVPHTVLLIPTWMGFIK